jgi:hypothetical protein
MLMLWAFKQLLVPLNYLRIKHGETPLQSKAVFDFVLPALLTALTLATCLWLGAPVAVGSHTGLAKHLLDLLALMVVFYMAALAAVATFDRSGIDDTFKGLDAILMVPNHEEGGARVERKLTYRQFISYLFGYLSFLSLCLYILMIFLIAGWTKLENKLELAGWNCKVFTWFLDPAIFLIVFFFLWQLFVTSLLGIYFLTERIQSLTNKEN